MLNLTLSMKPSKSLKWSNSIFDYPLLWPLITSLFLAKTFPFVTKGLSQVLNVEIIKPDIIMSVSFLSALRSDLSCGVLEIDGTDLQSSYQRMLYLILITLFVGRKNDFCMEKQDMLLEICISVITAGGWMRFWRNLVLLVLLIIKIKTWY